MPSLDVLLSRQLSRRRVWFTREGALALLPPRALTAALSKLIRKGNFARA
jgi:hypothetical protein